jgi:hypothetical protein
LRKTLDNREILKQEIIWAAGYDENTIAGSLICKSNGRGVHGIASDSNAEGSKDTISVRGEKYGSTLLNKIFEAG